MSLSERLNQVQITDDAPVGCAGSRCVCLLTVGCAGSRFVSLLAVSAAAMLVCDLAMLDSLYP